MTKNLLVSSVVLTAAIALTGCSTISSSLGLERHIPDESQVTVHPALTLPPDFDLKPPGTETAVSGDHEKAESNAVAEGVAPAKKPEEERGFFGKLFHGDYFFGGDDDNKSAAKPDEKGPDINGTPQAPAPTTPPAADASAPASPPSSPDVNGTPQAPATK